MSRQDYLIQDMAFSLGQRLRTTRELLGLTQQQVIEQLKNSYGINLSQQVFSCIENGKRKVDAEKELPAIASVYNKSIDYFDKFWKSPKYSLTRISDRSRKISFFENGFLKADMG